MNWLRVSQWKKFSEIKKASSRGNTPLNKQTKLPKIIYAGTSTFKVAIEISAFT